MSPPMARQTETWKQMRHDSCLIRSYLTRRARYTMRHSFINRGSEGSVWFKNHDNVTPYLKLRISYTGQLETKIM